MGQEHFEVTVKEPLPRQQHW